MKYDSFEGFFLRLWRCFESYDFCLKSSASCLFSELKLLCACAGDVAPVSRLSPTAPTTSVLFLSTEACSRALSRVTTTSVDGLTAAYYKWMRLPARAEPLVVLGRALRTWTMREAALPSSAASANWSESASSLNAPKSLALRRIRF